MSISQATYEKAVTTAREAEDLAEMHGFESIEHLAETLPHGSNVLDIGAGASPFGKRVAELRPDITWVNVDLSYSDPNILEEVLSDAPSNFSAEVGDATKLDEIYPPESFQAVFSYWLWGHLSLEGNGPALVAAKAVHTVLATGGYASIGPRAGRIDQPETYMKKSICLTKNAEIDADTFAEKIVKETKLFWPASYFQKIRNNVLTPFFGTTRYAKIEDGEQMIYDPERAEYVRAYSLKGANVLGRAAVLLARRSFRL